MRFSFGIPGRAAATKSSPGRRLVAVALVTFVGILAACDDSFLERFPLDAVAPQTFFRTENDLATYINGLYSYIPGGGIVSADHQSDNIEQKNYNRIVAGQHTVETSAEAAGWTWDYLRRVNFFLENYQRAEVRPDAAAHYAGVARFFRAWFYHDKVKRFGDVPWYPATLQPDGTDLYKPRDPRSLVMDSVLADLNFASANIATTARGPINRWVALALKARVALHEGTFRKYHGLPGSERFLEEAADAARRIIDGGAFGLFTTGDAANDYRNLFLFDAANRREVILAHTFDATQVVLHRANGIFLTGTLGAPGLTKSFTDSYLMRDGRPFTSVAGHDTMSFAAETRNRDPRLAQTMRTPGYKRIGGSTALVPDFDVSRTGYQPIKFVTSPANDNFNTNANDLPVFRYAEILLIYAEARAELGRLTQADLDISINRLRDRVGMPRMQLGAVTVDPVLAAQYPNTGGSFQAAILEIRRERRVEMALEGHRYDDLMRWKAGRLLAQTFEGMYFARTGEHDLDGNGTIDVAVVASFPATRKAGVQYLVLGTVIDLSQGTRGNVIVHGDVTKVFDEGKHYLFPLPRTELLLNDKLTQNPGW